MNKINQIIKTTSSFFIIIIPVLLFIFIIWRLERNNFPLPMFLETSRVFELCIIIIYPIFLIAWIFTMVTNRIRPVVAVILFFITYPVCCCAGSTSLYSEKQINVVQLEANRFHLVTYLDMDGLHDLYRLFKCNLSDMKCTIINEFTGIYRPHNNRSALIADVSTHEIHVFIDGVLEFTYGPTIKKYNLLDLDTLDDYDYWIAQYFNKDTAEFVLYRCDEETQVECRMMPFRYTTNKFNEAKLLADERTSELNVYIDDQLIYIYSAHPHCYVIGCSTSYK